MARREHHLAMPDLGSNDVESIVRLIQSSLTPVFLLTAVASLLSVFTTRLARISDQVKTLMQQSSADVLSDATMQRRLVFLHRRTYALDLAVILGTLAGVCTCGTVLSLFLGLIRSQATASILLFLFGTAVLCTIGALSAFLTEVLLASRGIRTEVVRHAHQMDL